MLDNQKGLDKSAVIGMVLVGAILIWMQFAFSPEEKDEVAEEVKTEKVEKKEIQEEENTVSPFVKTDSNNTVTLAEQKLFTLENEKIKLEIDSKGGKVVSAYIKEYKKYDKTPLNIINKEHTNLNLVYVQQGKKVSTKDIIFNGTEETTDNGTALVLTYTDATNASLKFKYFLEKDGYALKFNILSDGLKDQFSVDGKSKLEYSIDVPRQEKNLKNERMLSTTYYKESGEGVDNLSAGSDDDDVIKSADWIAFKDQFFATIIEPNTALKNVELTTVKFDEETEENYVEKLSLESTLAINGEFNYGFTFYFIPAHYKTLKDFDKDFHYIVDLGWGIFGWINRFVVIELFHLLEGFNLGYGIIILIMALVIKLALFPLTKKSYTSAAAMRVLKPQLDKIKEDFPGDTAKQQQEQMSLYGKAGVSPLSGCLPLLVQMPILFALFRFFPASIELRQEGFLWADDLSTYDSVFNLPFEIPFYGAHVSLFALLMAGSSFLQMIYNQQASSMGDNEQAKMMKNMMYFMPIIFLGVMNSYASALAYYYLIANLMTFGQQWFIRKNTDDAKILAKIEAKKAKKEANGGGGNRFQRRMEEMMKQQEQMKKK